MSNQNFYKIVADNNIGIKEDNVKSIFLWFDLFSFAFSFQLLFIISGVLGWNFAVTMLSTIFVIITDSLVKYTLAKDAKNYQELKGQMAFVKLWTVPLMFIAVATIFVVFAVAFGLI